MLTNFSSSAWFSSGSDLFMDQMFNRISFASSWNAKNFSSSSWFSSGYDLVFSTLANPAYDDENKQMTVDEITNHVRLIQLLFWSEGHSNQYYHSCGESIMIPQKE
jgi:hypothetical protein